MVSCPNVIRECIEHCEHSIPHDRCRMCTDGVCPVTHRRCECDEKPRPIDLSRNLRDKGKGF